MVQGTAIIHYFTLAFFSACLHLDACVIKCVIDSWTMRCHTRPVFSRPHRHEILNGNISKLVPSLLKLKKRSVIEFLHPM